MKLYNMFKTMIRNYDAWQDLCSLGFIPCATAIGSLCTRKLAQGACVTLKTMWGVLTSADIDIQHLKKTA